MHSVSGFFRLLSIFTDYVLLYNTAQMLQARKVTAAA